MPSTSTVAAVGVKDQAEAAWSIATRIRLSPISKTRRHVVQIRNCGRVYSVMGMIRSDAVEHVGAADERREPLDLVDEPLRRQEVQRAIHRGRCSRAPVLAQPVQQVIGAGGTRVVENEAEHLATLLRQPLLPRLAKGLCLIQQPLGVGRECRCDHATVIT